MTRVGNDVVDLQDPRCAAKAFDDRFVGRVLAPQEADRVRSAPDPDRSLWIHWAAKEAAFKVISKLLDSPPPFEHAAFVFRPAEGDGPARVHYRGTEVPIRIDVAPDRIHALGWFGDEVPRDADLHQRVHLLPMSTHEPPGRWRDTMRDRLSEKEWKSVHHPASAVVRLEARSDFARITGLEERRLEIVCDEGPPGRMPPRILHGGEAHAADITLSHHGRFVAWAFALPRARVGSTDAAGGGS